MKTRNGQVIRTLSKKYQLTIPKKFGEDLGLEPPTPVTITEDPVSKRIIIEPLRTSREETKQAFINACRELGEKWAKLGVTEKDIEAAIRESRKAS